MEIGIAAPKLYSAGIDAYRSAVTRYCSLLRPTVPLRNVRADSERSERESARPPSGLSGRLMCASVYVVRLARAMGVLGDDFY